jgi:hypothetical protein
VPLKKIIRKLQLTYGKQHVHRVLEYRTSKAVPRHRCSPLGQQYPPRDSIQAELPHRYVNPSANYYQQADDKLRAQLRTSVREVLRCPCCSFHYDRDDAAAINILELLECESQQQAVPDRLCSESELAVRTTLRGNPEFATPHSFNINTADQFVAALHVTLQQQLQLRYSTAAPTVTGPAAFPKATLPAAGSLAWALRRFGLHTTHSSQAAGTVSTSSAASASHLASSFTA